MLRLSERQYQGLAEAALLRQLRTLLLDRVRLPALRALLDDAPGCYALWRPLHDPGMTDYANALRLSVALVARMRGEDATERLRRLDDARDPEHEAKLLLEGSGALRYSEFDIE